MRSFLIAFPLSLLLATAAGAQTPSTPPWGAITNDLQSRLTLTAPPAKWSPLQVHVECRNASRHDISLSNVRVWLMLAQGPQQVYFTTAVQGRGMPDRKTLAPGETLSLDFDAAPLPAFPYATDFILQNGLPAPPPDSPCSFPDPAGKLGDILTIGTIRAKAFVIATLPDPFTQIPQATAIVSQCLTFQVPEPDFASLTPAQCSDLLATLFRGDAANAKSAHDHALSLGPAVIPQLLKLLADPRITDPARAWLTGTLLDFHDDRATNALISILDTPAQNSRSACLVAYLGPRTGNPRLTAAVDSVAHSSHDPVLVAWAIRGLALAGAPADPCLFETMITHSDAPGRAEAADILAAQTDPRAAPLLARLLGDENPNVRIHAAAAVAAHHRDDPAILAALHRLAAQADCPSRTAALSALQQLHQQ